MSCYINDFKLIIFRNFHIYILNFLHFVLYS